MEYKDLKDVNAKLPITNIKGKDYVEVAPRIQAFRKLFPHGTIDTEIVHFENGEVIIKALVSNDGQLLATGTAHEVQANGYINKTSFVENCETSAVGRALGFIGIGEQSIASADEVRHAIDQQTYNDLKQAQAPKSVAKATKKQIATIEANYDGERLQALLAHFGVQALMDMTEAQAAAVCKKIKDNE